MKMTPLADGDEAGDAHAGTEGLGAQRRIIDDAPRGKLGAQERRRVRAQRQSEEPVVVDHLLAERHRRQRDLGFATHTVMAGLVTTSRVYPTCGTQ